MSVLEAPVAVGIDLSHHHGNEGCAAIHRRLFGQLQSGYELCATMPLPRTLEVWQDGHRTARKRANRAKHRGYWASAFDRENWSDDIHEINTSKDVRQGRPMSAGYMKRQEFSPLPDYPCDIHSFRTSGVFVADGDYPKLVAYLCMYRSGDLCLVSQILGHAEHEPREVMFLLFEHALQREIAVGHPAVVVYNLWDSGTDGLRFFKERLGFEETRVEWLP